jgi:hypothetical protein
MKEYSMNRLKPNLFVIGRPSTLLLRPGFPSRPTAETTTTTTAATADWTVQTQKFTGQREAAGKRGKRRKYNKNIILKMLVHAGI